MAWTSGNDWMLVSADLEQIIKSLDQLQKDYIWHYTQVKACDEKTQDYLHAIEFDELGYKGRARLATQLETLRKERRQHKNAVEQLKIFDDWYESGDGRKALQKLRQILGKVRDTEKVQSVRTYTNKVVGKEESNTRG